MKTIDMYEINEEVFIKAKIQDIIVENGELKYKLTIEDSTNPLDHKYSYSQITPIVKNCFHDSPEDEEFFDECELDEDDRK